MKNYYGKPRYYHNCVECKIGSTIEINNTKIVLTEEFIKDNPDLIFSTNYDDDKIKAEAFKRGFVNGAVFYGYIGSASDLPICIGKNFNIESNEFGLYCDNSYIYYMGRWGKLAEAEPELSIITRKEYKVSEYLMDSDLEKKLNSMGIEGWRIIQSFEPKKKYCDYSAITVIWERDC